VCAQDVPAFTGGLTHAPNGMGGPWEGQAAAGGHHPPFMGDPTGMHDPAAHAGWGGDNQSRDAGAVGCVYVGGGMGVGLGAGVGVEVEVGVHVHVCACGWGYWWVWEWGRVCLYSTVWMSRLYGFAPTHSFCHTSFIIQTRKKLFRLGCS